MKKVLVAFWLALAAVSSAFAAMSDEAFVKLCGQENAAPQLLAALNDGANPNAPAALRASRSIAPDASALARSAFAGSLAAAIRETTSRPNSTCGFRSERTTRVRPDSSETRATTIVVDPKSTASAKSPRRSGSATSTGSSVSSGTQILLGVLFKFDASTRVPRAPRARQAKTSRRDPSDSISETRHFPQIPAPPQSKSSSNPFSRRTSATSAPWGTGIVLASMV